MYRRAKILILLGLIALEMTACGTEKEAEQNAQTVSAETIQMHTENIVESVEMAKESKPDIKTYEVSYKESAVKYEGEAFIKSVFGVGADMLYVCGIDENEKYFIAGMKQEEKEFNRFDVEVPSNMRMFNMAVDNQGKCHMLWFSIGTEVMEGREFQTITFEKSYITIINPDGELEETVDVTEVFQEEQYRPYCFGVDLEGNYYCEKENNIIILDSNGELKTRIMCDGVIDGMGCGKSGLLYCTYHDKDGIDRIGKIEQDAFVDCGVELPTCAAIYSRVTSGSDSEIFIYNLDGGIYTYDSESNSVEQRKSAEKLPVQGQDVSGYGFLGDGRLCLLAQNDGEKIFYYIPTGK